MSGTERHIDHDRLALSRPRSVSFQFAQRRERTVSLALPLRLVRVVAVKDPHAEAIAVGQQLAPRREPPVWSVHPPLLLSVSGGIEADSRLNKSNAKSSESGRVHHGGRNNTADLTRISLGFQGRVQTSRERTQRARAGARAGDVDREPQSMRARERRRACDRADRERDQERPREGGDLPTCTDPPFSARPPSPPLSSPPPPLSLPFPPSLSHSRALSSTALRPSLSLLPFPLSLSLSLLSCPTQLFQRALSLDARCGRCVAGACVSVEAARDEKNAQQRERRFPAKPRLQNTHLRQWQKKSGTPALKICGRRGPWLHWQCVQVAAVGKHTRRFSACKQAASAGQPERRR